MSKSILGIFLLAVVAVSIQAQKVSRVEMDVRSAIGKWAIAVKDRDQIALDAIFADDLFITDHNGQTRGKTEELDVLKPSKTLKTISVTNEDVAVRIYDRSKAAVVTAVVKMVFEVGGKESALSMRYTSVWEKRSGKWQIVVLQTARIAQPKT